MAAPVSEARPVAPPPPPSHTTSILPAAAVLLIAVVTLCTFAFLNVFDATTTTPTTLPVILGGPPVAAHTTVFAGFHTSGLPPADIASSLIAPEHTTSPPHGTVVTGGGGVGNYDNAVRLVVPIARANLLGFYRTNLVARGWKKFSAGTAKGGGAELLFQKAGSDGWYWEVGVVTDRATTSPTHYTFRLFQASDTI